MSRDVTLVFRNCSLRVRVKNCLFSPNQISGYTEYCHHLQNHQSFPFLLFFKKVCIRFNQFCFLNENIHTIDIVCELVQMGGYIFKTH